MMENHLLVEMDEEYSPIARLVELGRQKKYVTIDDILQFLPEAERMSSNWKKLFRRS
jgi:RNA polymerase primary sigma factor